MADLLNVKKAAENEFWFSIPFLHGLKDLFKAGANIHFGAYKDAENSLGFSISGNGMLGLYDISYHPPKGNPKK
jgi:invasion protein IalB